MRKNVLTLLFCFGAMLGANTHSSAQVLIDYWNFNTDSAAALTPTFSAVAGASLAYSGAYYDTVQSGATLNGVGADGTSLAAGAACLRLRNPASGPFTLTLPTTGYKNIVLAYAEQRTKKGAQQNIVTYTVDGTTWINTAISANATYYVDSTDTVTNGFQLETFDFSSDTMTNNNPNFKVQINFAVGDTNSSGNDRFDNITLQGTALPGTGVAVTNAAVGYNVFPNPVTNTLELTAATDGNRSLSVINTAGQSVFAGNVTGRNFTINTAGFSAGSYFIFVRDQNSGQVNTMKFIKQ